MNQKSTFITKSSFNVLATTRVLLLFALMLVGVNSWAGTKTFTISSGTTIAWSSIVWSPTGAPASTDDVVITNNLTGGANYSITGVPTVLPASGIGQFASFTVNGSGTGTVTLTASSATSLWTNKIVINNNTSFVGISNVSSVMTSTTSSVAANKTWTLASGCIITMGTGGVMTVSGTISGTNNNLFASANTMLLVANGGIININTSGTTNIAVPNMTVQSGGTTNVNNSGTGNITIPALSVLSGGLLTAKGSSTNTINMSSSPTIAGTFSVEGSFSISGSTAAATYSGTASTLQYKNSATLTASLKEWPTTAPPANVIVNNSATLTLGAGRTITGTLTMTAGTLSATTGTLDINSATGAVALGGGTLALAGATLQFSTTNTTPITRTAGAITAGSSSSLYFVPATTPKTWTVPASTLSGTIALANFKVAMGSAGSVTLNNTTDITISSAFDIVSGLTILGTGNMQLASSVSYATNGGLTPSATNMIVTSSTSGYFKRTIGSNGTAYTFPIGESTSPNNDYSGFSLTFSSGAASQVIGFRVIDGNPPVLGSATNYLSRYWQVSNSNSSGSYTYSMSPAYNGTTGDVNGTEASVTPVYGNGVAAWTAAGGGSINTSTNVLVISGATQATAPLTNANYFAGIDLSLPACPSPTGPNDFVVSTVNVSTAPVSLGGTVYMGNGTTNTTGIIIFANTSNTSAVPVDGVDYNVGDQLPSGAIVIFKGGTVGATIPWSYNGTGGTHQLAANTYYYLNYWAYASGACQTNYNAGASQFSAIGPNIYGRLAAIGAVGSCNNQTVTANQTFNSALVSGGADEYNIIWQTTGSNAVAAGFANIPAGATSGTINTAFTTAGSLTSPISITVPAGTAPGTYFGKMNTKNSNYSWTELDNNGAGISNLSDVIVTVTAGTAAPTGTASQTLACGSTVSNLSATGTSIQWYAAATGGSPLATSTVLVTGTTYYATQTVSSCESDSRFAVAVTLTTCGPALHNVTGGSHCASTGGTTVGLDGAESSVSYQLVLNGVTNVGSPVTGQTGAFSFGTQTTPGTYTVVGTNGSSVTMTGTAVVYATPTVSYSGLSTTYCVNASAATLTGSPSGGTFSGSGISGNTFTSSTAGTGGPYTITYTYNDANTCTNNATHTTTVNALPTVGFSGLNTAYCVDASAATLTGSPSGGTFSGSGISGSTFTPATAGTGGPYTITYSYTDGNSCTNSTTHTTTVNALPTVGFSGLSSTYCASASAATLTGSPAGGNFSGTGISGNTFVPSTAGVGGPYTITYTYTDGNSCTNAATHSTTVNAAAGTVSITPPSATVVSGGAGVNLTASSANATSFAWSPTTGLSPTSGANLNANPTSTTTYTVTASTANGCAASNTVVITFSACSTNNWTGTVSTDWFDASNWSCGIVPTASTDVVIPSTGVTYYPEIVGPPLGAQALTKNITIQSGANVNVMCVNGIGLEVHGNFSNSGSSILGCGKVTAKGGSGQSFSGDNHFHDLEIDNTSGVAIVSGMQTVAHVLTLKNGTLTTGGNLTIASDATGTGLIDNFTTGNTGTISGNLTVQRYAVNTGSAFFYIGAPVSGATIADWSNDFANPSINGAVDGSAVLPTATCDLTALQSTSPYAGIFDYRENAVTTCALQGWHTRFIGSIPDGQGFIGIVPVGRTIDVTGGFNSGSSPVSTGTLTRSATNGTGSKGFNLVANPYVAPIEWLDLSAANSNIQGTAYVYEVTGGLSGTYLPLNFITGGGEIGTSEAFFVDVAAAQSTTTLSFVGSARRNSTNNYLRTAVPYESILTLDIKGNGFADKARIAFGQNFTTKFDGDYDARKIMSRAGQPSLYVTEGEDNYSIYAQPAPEVVKNVAVSLEPGATGQFTITANDLGSFDANQVVVLEDLKLKVKQDLTTNAAYTFTADANDNTARFVVHFTQKTDAVTTVDQNANVKISGYANQVDVVFNNFTNPEKLTMNIYDLTGRKVIERQELSTGSSHHVVKLNNIVTGYYFVVLTGNDYEKAEKVFISIDK